MNGRRFFAASVLCLIPLTAGAAATIESVKGDVRIAQPGVAPAAAQAKARVPSGATVSTGADGQVVLRFDDNSAVALNQNSEFRITEFFFARGEPARDRSAFELVRGALRMITGLLAQRNAGQVALRFPQATLSIRGTDFLLALENPAYISVIQGAVSVSNAAGTVAFGAGSIGTVAGPTALATSISAAALPAGVSSAFAAVGGIPVAGAAAVGVAAAAPAAAIPAAAIGAAAAAAAAAAALGGADDAGTTTTTHHPTATHH